MFWFCYILTPGAVLLQEKRRELQSPSGIAVYLTVIVRGSNGLTCSSGCSDNLIPVEHVNSIENLFQLLA